MRIGKDGPIEDAETAPAPEPWDQLFPKLWKKGLDFFREHETKKLSREIQDRERISRAWESVARATHTRKFLEGDFWKDHFGPLLAAHQEIEPWRPGQATDHMTIVSRHLTASGEALFARKIEDTLKQWMDDGESAKKLIEADNERRRRIKEMSDR